ASSAAANSTIHPWGQLGDSWMVTHRSPWASKASPSGVPGKFEIEVTGVGEPDVANCPFVYSKTRPTLFPTTQRLPPRSNAMPKGLASAPVADEMVTLGTGLAVASWARVSSTRL